tara:strand:- start:42 stop:581 length:540 start_codon:yes stop_codon:yes gene_type:complete
MDTFASKYRDPRWQKRRLEIMSNAGFACEECLNKAATLNVHHKFYKKGASPWEYNDSELMCLCEICHHEYHVNKKKIERHLLGFKFCELPFLHGILMGLNFGNCDLETVRIINDGNAISKDKSLLHAFYCGDLINCLVDAKPADVIKLKHIFNKLNPDGFSSFVNKAHESICDCDKGVE